MNPSVTLTLQKPTRLIVGYRLLKAILGLLVLSLLGGCGSQSSTPISTPPPLAEELIFYDWKEDMPQSILDAFTKEYGVKVIYLDYKSQEEAVRNVKAGKAYDVVVIENDYIPQMVAAGLLAELDFRNVPNFKNISANFRDLAYDPDNQHTIPFNWGTTGLLIRSDLVAEPVTRWADLWKLQHGSKIALRDEPRDQLGAALKSLGYSANSEDPIELEAALEQLLKLKQNAAFVDTYAEGAIPLLATGEVVALIGWAEDALEARKKNEAIVYILPEEGAMLWGDNFVIPANSPRRYTAEIFLNFLLRPEISAQIVNQNYYATANEAAHPFIDSEILSDPVIFPSNQALRNAEVYLPLSPVGDKLYEDIWNRFKSIEAEMVNQ